jgi:Virus neck protein
MAKSPYFNKSTESERQLYQDIITESIYIMGDNILYLPRTIVNFDTLFGEDVLSKYTDSYLLEAYQDNQTTGFGDDVNMFTKFGLAVKDECTYTVSKSSFERIVLDNNLTAVTRPLEGDLVYNLISGQLFQIKFVENEIPYRLFGDVQTYKLYCEAYKYSSQRITADLVEPEADLFSTSINITMLTGSGDYVVDKTVTNGLITMKVVDWNLPLKQLKVVDRTGQLDTTIPIVGSDVSWTISSWKTTNDSNSKFDINQFLEDKSDVIIDQSEKIVLGDVVTSNFMANF